MPEKPPRQVPIAVVGVAALMPGSVNAASFWRNIVSGRDLITDVPPSHWRIDDYYNADPTAPDKTYCKRGGFLPEVDFDPLEYGIPPSSLPATDPSQLLALVVAKKLIDDMTDGDPARLAKNRMSVIVGVTAALETVAPLISRLQQPVLAKAMRESGLPASKIAEVCERFAKSYVPWQEPSFPGLLNNVIAGRIANRFDTHGTNMTTDAACASSLSSLQVAINELALGQSDVAIAGGVDTDNDIFAYMCFSKTPALSLSGDCRPFSDQADGTLIGEGLALFALKRLNDAERDGDRIYAVIRGLGSSSDGRYKSIYAPRPEGQSLALRRTYESAGYGPETVELVEAHGTGTKAGDAAEIEALKAVFISPDGRQRWCALGSVKSQIGHTKGTAGAAGLFKAVLALHQKVLPPTIKVERPNPALGLESSPFYLNTAARPWIRNGAHPRRAAVSSFGFGGTNFHLTLEEYVPNGQGRRARDYRAVPSELFVLSADSSTALQTQIAKLLEQPRELEALARATQLAFAPKLPARVGVVADSFEDLKSKLSSVAAALLAEKTALTAPGVYLQIGSPIAGEVAFLFPGQGSQYTGMGADLALGFEAARQVWDGAPRFDEVGLHELTFPRPVWSHEARAALETKLTATEWAQPAIGAASLATLAVLRMVGLHAACTAGHSFGELTALSAAGAISSDDLLLLARTRGELMRDAARTSPGAMLSVRKHPDEVQALLKEHAKSAVIANHNGPQDVVVSGAREVIAAFEEILKAAEVQTRRLPVSAAFHSPAVAPAVPALSAFLDSIAVRAPKLPVYGNGDAAPYSVEPQTIRQQLAQQLAQPVRFAQIIEAMYARGVRVFVEVGPSSVLTDMVGRILHEQPHLAVETDRRNRHGMTSLMLAFARLSAAGVKLDFTSLWEPEPTTAATKKGPGMQVKLCGTNYGKPYPPPSSAPAQSSDAETAAPVVATSAAPKEEVAAAAGVALASPPVAVPVSLPPHKAAAEPHPAWAAAFQEVQRQTAEAHAAFQRALADSHTAFLNTAAASLQALSALCHGGAAAPVQPAQPLPQPVSAPVVAPQFRPPPVAAAPAVPVLHSPPVAAPSKVAVLAELDLRALFISIVAEKTGYAESLLGLEMDLEADLGIDSIKRVEILAAMRDRVPALPDVNPTEIASLRTLGAVDEFLRRSLEAASVVTAKSAASTPPPARVVAAATVTVTATATGPGPAIERYAVRMSAAPASGLGISSLFAGGKLVVTDEGGGVAAALAQELAARGIAAEVVCAVPPDADAVIFLGGLRAVESRSAALAVNREAFQAARTVAPRFAAGEHLFVTVQDTGGDFGLSGSAPDRAWLGGLTGLARTLRSEWPQAAIKAIDCARGGRSPAALAVVIADELCQGGGAFDVGIDRNGRRAVPRLVASALPAEPALPLAADSVVVATGGARGVTAAALVALAESARPRIALLGRTPLFDEPASCRAADDEASVRRALVAEAQAQGRAVVPAEITSAAATVLASREIRATLSALRAAGSEAQYFAVDVRNSTTLGQVLSEVRARWGAITALVHGAGVLADKRVIDKTDEQYERVFSTKVDGLCALLDATAADPLRFICLFSSSVAFAGNAGQADYAMANEVLNQVAAAEQARRGNRCVVRALGWGPWRGGMVTSSLERHFEQRGISLISLADGARTFVGETSAAASDAVVLLGSLPTAESAASLTLELHLNAQSHPQLLDHAVAGQPVVPMAMVIDWFWRALRAAHPDRAVAVLRALKVRRGLRLERFARGERLQVRVHAPSGFEPKAVCTIELLSAAGVVHYTATAELGDAKAASVAPAPPTALDAFLGPIYDGHILFHGPRFQMLRAVEGCSKAGAVATLRGVEELGWPADAWQVDPAVLDGANQLTGLCGAQVLGGATLPMAIAEVTVHKPGPLGGPLKATAWVRSVHTAKIICDVVITDFADRILVEVRGIETILRPDSAPEARGGGRS